jgi:NAD(P)-dependent dehydrogenase (short-subunit alcohol dehydrogenase family)
MHGAKAHTTGTVLITGVSPSSIGADTAYAIASGEPKKLILASRTTKNIDAVSSTIKSRYPSVTVQSLILDLSSQKSVRDAAANINHSVSELDLLIANAGIMAVPTRTLSPEGIELQFATNHIGHFLFVNLVLEKLRAAAKASKEPGSTRVVMLSSNGHRFSPVRFHDYNFEGKPIPLEEAPNEKAMVDRGIGAPVFDEQFYHKFVSYGQSKTANILFTLYLRTKLAHDGIQAIAVHPGSK